MSENVIITLKDKEAIFDYMLQQYRLIEKLSEENEQLKKEIKEFTKSITYC